MAAAAAAETGQALFEKHKKKKKNVKLERALINHTGGNGRSSRPWNLYIPIPTYMLLTDKYLPLSETKHSLLAIVLRLALVCTISPVRWRSFLFEKKAFREINCASSNQSVA